MVFCTVYTRNSYCTVFIIFIITYSNKRDCTGFDLSVSKYVIVSFSFAVFSKSFRTWYRYCKYSVFLSVLVGICSVFVDFSSFLILDHEICIASVSDIVRHTKLNQS